MFGSLRCCAAGLAAVMFFGLGCFDKAVARDKQQQLSFDLYNLTNAQVRASTMKPMCSGRLAGSYRILPPESPNAPDSV